MRGGGSASSSCHSRIMGNSVAPTRMGFQSLRQTRGVLGGAQVGSQTSRELGVEGACVEILAGQERLRVQLLYLRLLHCCRLSPQMLMQFAGPLVGALVSSALRTDLCEYVRGCSGRCLYSPKRSLAPRVAKAFRRRSSGATASITTSRRGAAAACRGSGSLGAMAGGRRTAWRASPPVRAHAQCAGLG